MLVFFASVLAAMAALALHVNATLVLWIAGWALASVVWFRAGNDDDGKSTKLGALAAFVIFSAVIWTWTLAAAIQPHHFVIAVGLKIAVGVGILALVCGLSTPSTRP